MFNKLFEDEGDIDMSVWKDFEESSVIYLNKTFGDYANFILQGGSDSNKEDILVKRENGKDFYIEAKHSPAQCGQFVLLPNIQKQEFEYSSKNFTTINQYSQRIIDYMNSYFEEFKEAGTAGKTIEFENCENIFVSWILDYYKTKGAKFFITNQNIIFPIEQFSEYFTVSAKYRIKRSGSSAVGNKYINNVEKYIKDNFPIKYIEKSEDKLFIASNVNLHNKRFIIDGYEFMISARDDKYEIRKLSNTFNANVIFSVHLKDNKEGISITEFIKILLS